MPNGIVIIMASSPVNSANCDLRKERRRQASLSLLPVAVSVVERRVVLLQQKIEQGRASQHRTGQRLLLEARTGKKREKYD